jgi:hypothetical protein
MDNLQRALAGVGAGFEHIVCVRIFLTDFERDYAASIASTSNISNPANTVAPLLCSISAVA